MFASSWQDFDTVCLATALHRLGKLELGRDYYELLSRQLDFVRLLTMIGEATVWTHSQTPRVHASGAQTLSKTMTRPGRSCGPPPWLWSGITCGCARPSLLRSTPAYAGERLSEFTARNISNTVRMQGRRCITACEGTRNTCWLASKRNGDVFAVRRYMRWPS